VVLDAEPNNHAFQVLSKHGVYPCSATLHECQTEQMPRRSRKTTGISSYYMDEDYPAGPEIQ